MTDRSVVRYLESERLYADVLDEMPGVSEETARALLDRIFTMGKIIGRSTAAGDGNEITDQDNDPLIRSWYEAIDAPTGKSSNTEMVPRVDDNKVALRRVTKIMIQGRWFDVALGSLHINTPVFSSENDRGGVEIKPGMQPYYFFRSPGSDVVQSGPAGAIGQYLYGDVS